MARDPFDISRWNRNFYLRINHEVKKASVLKGFCVRFSGSLPSYQFTEYNRNLFILNYWQNIFRHNNYVFFHFRVDFYLLVGFNLRITE